MEGIRKGIRKAGRAGFTLIELLVVLVGLALIAAFVLPDVLGQLDKGDPVRAAGDLRNVQTGVEQFYFDMRNVWPGDVEDLVHTISTTESPLNSSGNYSSVHVDRWNGPYINFGVREDQSDALQTSYGATIVNGLSLRNGDDNSDASSTCSSNTWVAATIQGLTGADFVEIDDVIDGHASDRGTIGRLRWAGSTPISGNLTESADAYFFLAPCRG